MNLKLDQLDVIELLQSVRRSYYNSKDYFKEYLAEEERIGVTSPEEWKCLYNNILDQLHIEEGCELLKNIK